MADGCDDPRQIDDLVRLVERGVAVAAASRYMAGGQQVGGPFVKGLMSRTGGPVAAPARPGRHPGRDQLVQGLLDRLRPGRSGIDSRDGFEIGIELTAKARRLRLPVAEIPTIWLDRQAGVSNFKIARWIPELPALVPVRLRAAADRRAGPGRIAGRTRPPLVGSRPRTRRASHGGAPDELRDVSAMTGSLVSGSGGFIGGYVVEELLARGYAVVGRGQLLQVRPGPQVLRRPSRATGWSRVTPATPP